MKTTKLVILIFFVGALSAVSSYAQPAPEAAQSQNDNVVTGTVVSSTANTVVVRTESGQYHLFSFDRNTTRPRALTPGSKVSIASKEGEGSRVATAINVTAPAPGGQEPQASRADPVPQDIRDAEREIERQARRFHAGGRVGIGLDPEVITAGIQARMGPFFNPRVFFRPTAEFGFGEVTTLVALNLETIYQLPLTMRQGRWSPYVGLGPGINFINRGFEEDGSSGRNIDFNDFDFEGSLNIVVGMESRSGMFLEMRGTAFSRPQIRLFLGYSF